MFIFQHQLIGILEIVEANPNPIKSSIPTILEVRMGGQVGERFLHHAPKFQNLLVSWKALDLLIYNCQFLGFSVS